MLILLLMILWTKRSKFVSGSLRLTATPPLLALLLGLCCVIPCNSTNAQDPNFPFSRGGFGEGTQRQNRKSQQHLREGTLIPPSIGRIVMLGRRWAFVPSNGQPDPDDDVVINQPQVPRARTAGYKPRPVRIGLAAQSSKASTPRTLLVGQEGVFQRPNDEELPHIIVAENLMLQRIVEAIRADASDEHWTISGEVTEFFNENRLIIRTAQRANVN